MVNRLAYELFTADGKNTSVPHYTENFLRWTLTHRSI